jgi:transcriptional regulator with XRE-family HTH domain
MIRVSPLNHWVIDFSLVLSYLPPRWRSVETETVWEAIDTLRSRVVKWFRQGVSEACLGAIWKHLDTCCLTQQEIADRVGVDRSTVTKWMTEGAISFESFCFLITLLHEELGECKFPPIEERIASGWVRAISKVREVILEDRRPVQHIMWHEVQCLASIFSTPEWHEAQLKERSELLQQATERVLKHARSSIPQEEREAFSVRFRTVKDVEQLVGKWGAAFVVTLLALEA